MEGDGGGGGWEGGRLTVAMPCGGGVGCERVVNQ